MELIKIEKEGYEYYNEYQKLLKEKTNEYFGFELKTQQLKHFDYKIRVAVGLSDINETVIRHDGERPSIKDGMGEVVVYELPSPLLRLATVEDWKNFIEKAKKELEKYTIPEIPF